MAALEFALTANGRSARSGSQAYHGRPDASSARRLPIAMVRMSRNLSARLLLMPRNPVLKLASSTRTIAFLGNYLPRKCGIATFTSDLLEAVASLHPRSRCFAVAVNDVEGHYQYPKVVRCEIQEQDLDSYRRTARFLNASNLDIVSVQHEFGIFGGPAGSHLLALLRDLTTPVVTTLHTALLT